jgi:adenylosuccinate synthase
MDLVALRHSAQVSGATELAVTLLDVLAVLDELLVCTHYRLHGRPTDRFPASSEALATAEPVYARLPGFAAEIADCRRWEDLPASARAYVGVIENYVGVPVTLVSVGPDRSQTLERPRV